MSGSQDLCSFFWELLDCSCLSSFLLPFHAHGRIAETLRQTKLWIAAFCNDDAKISVRMGGAPCFYGTRLPVSSLFENLEGGVSIDEWLDAFPSVTRQQAIDVLEYARNRMLEPAA